jgi:hypothetical protein
LAKKKGDMSHLLEIYGNNKEVDFISQRVFWGGEGRSFQGFLSYKERGHWINNGGYYSNPCGLYLSCPYGLYSDSLVAMGVLKE